MREPAVAHRFYPGNARELERTVRDLLPPHAAASTKALALIAPHAGYIYSGGLAGQTIGSAHIPETVIILGPNHHGRGAPIALAESAWRMPGGIVPIDREITGQLAAASTRIKIDDNAHLQEHSLEVQLPFLQALQPKLQIVPLVVSHISYQDCTETAEAIASVLTASARDILILASTDMSHYESRASASAKDKKALARITALDPEGLYHTVIKESISMCGFIPVTITLRAAALLGATQVELIGYTDSGAISKDTEQVVGYAGLIIT